MDTNHRPERLNAKVTTSLETARKNKNKLRELVETAGMTDAQIVNIVMAESKRPCGVRTLIGWLSGDEQKKLQRCPDWAIEALEKGLRDDDPVRPLRSRRKNSYMEFIHTPTSKRAGTRYYASVSSVPCEWIRTRRGHARRVFFA